MVFFTEYLYMGVIIILNNNNAYRDEKRSVYISDTSSEDNFSLDEILLVDTSPKEKQGDARIFVDLLVEFWDNNIDTIFKKARDRDIANAIVHLLRRVDYIDNFNKKAIYLMVREMTDQRTPHVTKVINKMKIHHAEKMSEYRMTGHISLTMEPLNINNSQY